MFVAKPKPICPNMTKEERKALQDLRKDDSHMVLAADKGNALVIMDKDMFIEKYMTLLNDEEVYKECRDQTKPIHSIIKATFTSTIFYWTQIQGTLQETLSSG